MKVARCSNKTCGFITSTTTVQVISVTCLQPICEHFFILFLTDEILSSHFCHLLSDDKAQQLNYPTKMCC